MNLYDTHFRTLDKLSDNSKQEFVPKSIIYMCFLWFLRFLGHFLNQRAGTKSFKSLKPNVFMFFGFVTRYYQN